MLEKIFKILTVIIYVVTTRVSYSDSGLKAPFVGLTLDGLPCSGGSNPYGPYDYTNSMHRTKKLPIVETHHFSKNIETLKHGNRGPLVSEFDYTLLTFPNHHKALAAAAYYEILFFDEIKKGEKRKLNSPLECYFQRAIRFSPKDGVVRMMYGKHLRRKGLIKPAFEQYKKATEVSPENSVLRYNYAFFLIKRKKYEEAKTQAKVAYKLKHKNQKLKKTLAKLGYWD